MRPSSYTYVKISPTQHWRRVGDEWGRDWVVRRSDGQLRLATYRDRAVA